MFFSLKETIKTIAQSPSQSFFIFCSSFILGIALAGMIRPEVDLSWMVSVFVLGSVFVLMVKNIFFRLFFVSGILCLLGFFLYAQRTNIPVSGTIKQGINHTIRISGVIDE